jgi:hypothetical protein
MDNSKDEQIIMICPGCDTPYYVKGGMLVHDLSKLDVAKLVNGSALCTLCENERQAWPRG